MKNILIYSFLAVLFSTSALAQRCDKYNRYCDADLYDYDYSVQSAYAHLYPGDTIPVKTVLYGNKEYHITVCSDYENIPWKIVQPFRKTIKILKEVRREKNEIYKTDEYGDFLIDDETGDYIIESSEITVDTIWNSERVTDEELLFENSKTVDWKMLVKKSQRAFIYVTLPMDADPEGACVAIFIGRNQKVKSKFVTKKPSGKIK